MATVIVPSDWLTMTGGARRLDLPATTVAELRQALADRYPSLQAWLDNGQGGLPEFMHIFVGETDIHVLDDLATPLQPADEVRFIPIMAGGD